MKNTKQLLAMKILLNSREVVQDKAHKRSRHLTLHQLNRDRSIPMTKMAFIGNLLPKLLFFIPFSAVLILSGFLCLKIQNSTAITPTISNCDRAVVLDKFK